MILGIIGAGQIGSTLGRLWVGAKHTIVFGTTKPEKHDALVRELAPRASSRPVHEAVAQSDVVLIATPFYAWPALAAEIQPFLGAKPVIDATNFDIDRDGDIGRRASEHRRGTVGVIEALIPAAHLVKAFNTMQAGFLAKEANRAADRYAVPIAGDDADSVHVVSRLVEDAGFDAVIVGPAARAKDFDRGTPVWNRPLPARELAALLGVAWAPAPSG